MDEMLTPKGLIDFLAINYSNILEQYEENGISELLVLTHLIDQYSRLHEYLLEGIKDGSQETDEKKNEILHCRKAIEGLKSKKKILEQQNDLKKTIEDLNNSALDYSETNAKRKIIYLHQLGILDFLRQAQKPNTSVNAIAEILSAITGEKTITLQPYLNPIFNTNNEQARNPLRSSKHVDEVNKHLDKKGFERIDKKH